MPLLHCLRTARAGVAIAAALATVSSRAAPSETIAAPACRAAHAGGVPPRRVAALARGFNLPGWLDGHELQRPPLDNLPALRARGFTHIRLPLAAEAVMPRFAGAEIRRRRLEALDRALDRLDGAGYAVIIDLAPGTAFARLARTDPEAALDQVKAAWRTIAERVRRRSADRVFFELLNEPPIDDAVWTAWLTKLMPVVRQVAPERTLIVGPAPFQRFEALAAWRPFDDRNVVYAFHFYDPMAFTHQGASWDPDSPLAPLAGVPFPATKEDPRIAAQATALEAAGHARSAAQLKAAYANTVDAAAVTTRFAQVARWSAANDRPVIVDEFGVLADKAPTADRRAWIAAVRSAAERFCFGWTHWEFAQGFGFVDPVTGRPDPGLMEALLGGRASRPSTKR